MRTLRNCRSVVLGVAVCRRVLVVTGAGPDAAKSAPQAKEQAYEANFECAIPAGGANCTVAADQRDSRRQASSEWSLSKAADRNATATKTAFEFYVELGDPSAPGGVRAIHVVPDVRGQDRGGFYNIYAANGEGAGVRVQNGELTPRQKSTWKTRSGDRCICKTAQSRTGC